MAGIDDEENELGVLEFIHAFVEILDKHFGQVGVRLSAKIMMWKIAILLFCNGALCFMSEYGTWLYNAQVCELDIMNEPEMVSDSYFQKADVCMF